MKLSLTSLLRSIIHLITHYPLLFVTSIIITLIGRDIIRERGLLTDIFTDDQTGSLITLLITSLVIGTGIYARPRRRNPARHLLIIIALMIWRWMLPADMSEAHIIMIVTMGVAALSWLIRGPLDTTERDHTYIHYRLSTIIQNIALGLLLTLILAGGLSAALGAIEALFDIWIASERYSIIWLTVSIIIGTNIVMSGILTDQRSYTTPARRQTILAWAVSLLTLVFGIILYIYLAKILITQSRPSNQITLRSFVLISLVLIASMMLIPLLDHTPEKKHTIQTRAHVLIIPIIVMAGIALTQRVQEYGLTPQRYLGIALLIIIAGTSIWQIITRRSTPYPLLVTISLAGLLAIFGGPLSARGLSYHSQITRLTDYLTTQGLYDGEQIDLPLDVTDEQYQIIRGYFRYLADDDRPFERLHPELTDGDTLFEKTGIDRYGYYQIPVEDTYKQFRLPQSTLDITGYTRLHTNLTYSTRNNENTNPSLTDTIRTYTYKDTTYTIDLSATIDELSQIEDDVFLPIELSTVTENNSLLLIESITIQKKSDTRVLEDITATLLTK